MDLLDEQLDLINEANEVLGVVGKAQAHREGSLHRLVIGELLNSRGEYCFVKQAGDRQDPGQYVSAVGGHVGAGESVEAALIRECQEEVGFTPSQFSYVGRTILNRSVIGRRENHLFLVYVIKTDLNPVLNEESVEYEWLSVPAIKAVLRTNPTKFGAAWHHIFKHLFPDIYSLN